MVFTGERYIPEIDLDSEISIYHLQRYMSVLGACKDKIVLDAACGEGYGSNLIATVAKKVMGIDISEEAVKNANNKYSNDILNFMTASVEKLPFEDNSFDVIISFETIEHVNESIQKQFLNEIERVLKKDGILIMSSPDKKNYSDIPNFKNEFHVHEMYFEEFDQLLQNKFSEIEYYYQGMYCNSYIFKKDKGISNITNELQLREPDDTLAEYFIAVCSNSHSGCDLETVVFDAMNRYYKQDIEIKTLKERLGDPNKIIEQKENYICEQREILSSRDNEIRELNGIIEQKENYINEQREIISSKDNEIRELNEIIEQKEDYIREQRESIEKLKTEIGNMKTEIGNMKTELEGYSKFTAKKVIRFIYKKYCKQK